MNDLFNDRAVIGANNPPPYDPAAHADCIKKVQDFADAAGAWLDLKEIDSDEQSGRLTDFITGARGVYKAIDTARKTAKQPHDDAGKAVQAAQPEIIEAAS